MGGQISGGLHCTLHVDLGMEYGRFETNQVGYNAKNIRRKVSGLQCGVGFHQIITPLLRFNQEYSI